MGLLRGPDFFYAVRFLRLLTTKWEKTNAYKLGIIDKNGKKLRTPEKAEEKSAYNIFHRLVFNIKRLINKLPFGKSTLASYLGALFLIKEHTRLTDEEIKKVMKEACGLDLKDYKPEINEWYLDEYGNIEKGKYALLRDVALPRTGDLLAKEGTLVEVTNQKSVDTIFGYPVFKVKHIDTQQNIYVTLEDIKS